MIIVQISLCTVNLAWILHLCCCFLVLFFFCSATAPPIACAPCTAVASCLCTYIAVQSFFFRLVRTLLQGPTYVRRTLDIIVLYVIYDVWPILSLLFIVISSIVHFWYDSQVDSPPPQLFKRCLLLLLPSN